MKKTRRVTCRYDAKTYDFRKHLFNHISRCLRHNTNHSEINRALYQVLSRNKKLRASVAKEVRMYLAETI